MARPIKVITAGAEIRAELQRRANAPTSAHRDRFRAKIILLRLEGLKIATVAKRLKTSMATVSTWSARFEAHGLDGLNDKSGRGRKPSITEKKIERVVTDATRPPKNRKRCKKSATVIILPENACDKSKLGSWRSSKDI